MCIIGLGCGVVPCYVGYTGHEEMASSCARGEFRLDTLSSLKEWLNFGTGSPGKWWGHHPKVEVFKR